MPLAVTDDRGHFQIQDAILRIDISKTAWLILMEFGTLMHLGPQNHFAC